MGASGRLAPPAADAACNSKKAAAHRPNHVFVVNAGDAPTDADALSGTVSALIETRKNESREGHVWFEMENFNIFGARNYGAS